jgi:RNA polymerase sigma factor FliA
MTDRLTSEQQDLVARNLALVEHIVKRLMARFPSTYDRDDLVQAGTMGLIEASTRFDPSHGIAFSTFAGRRIEGSVIDQLRRNDWAPRSVRANERRLDQAEAELTARHGRSPDEHTLASALALDVDDVRTLRTRIARASIDSLDRTVGRDNTGVPLSETIVDDDSSNVELHLDEAELRGYLRDALALLPERHKLVVKGHFLEGRSMTELGELLGVTQSRASQLKEDALRMMRQALRAQYREGDPPTQRVTRREQAYTEAITTASTWRERLSPVGADGP